jgi:FKBP-type peptidyl-prolyl cis-trans isomerase
MIPQRPALLSVALVLGACRLGTEPTCVAPPPHEVVDVRGDTTVTATGLRYLILRAGEGEPVEPCDRVGIHYRVFLPDGQPIEVQRGDEPYRLTLGGRRALPGIEEGIVGMRTNELRRLILPPDLAYGASGAGPVPPGTSLLVDVELISAPVR